MLALTLTFGAEIVGGVLRIGNSHNKSAMDVLQNVLAASLLMGIARSWDSLVGGTPASSRHSRS